MSKRRSVLSIEDWREVISSKRNGNSAILSICGPSGVGKTTVVKTLSENFPAFVETTDGNPHFEALLTRKTEFDAAANQKWFLQRTSQHIAHANPQLPLILDQDPAAIVLAYSRIFLEDDQMTKAQYNSLLERLLKIEGELQNWTSPRTVLFLDAPADVLRHRVLRRWGKSHTPPLKWFDRLRNHFVQLFTCFPNAITASTVELSPEQVISRARALIKRRIKDAQA